MFRHNWYRSFYFLLMIYTTVSHKHLHPAHCEVSMVMQCPYQCYRSQQQKGGQRSWIRYESYKIFFHKKRGCRRTPSITSRCLCVYIERSEVVLDAQLTTNTEVIIVFSSQEGDLTIYSEGIGNGDANTCFTRELGVSFFAVNSDDCRTSLDVVRSSTCFSFKTYVKVCRGSGVVIANPTSIGFYVDVGTCKGSASGQDRAAEAANTDLNICFTFSYLRNGYPQMNRDSTVPCYEYPLLFYDKRLSIYTTRSFVVCQVGGVSLPCCCE